ncbi:hypothetical protein [Merismopedia glauca]|uniref:DUF2808 domain-containing protein n=1 Tax=Merismopedia glauca CCAP 1448/3 TaxID=1296344 RepID=A0A2T1C4L4_9CYAN|nr:hypothetical protein [Merismopedia glauca]PSB03222.1 hypothetical protein C7B64_09380 [Merismopedia glauca CCAP 1448/3]
MTLAGFICLASIYSTSAATLASSDRENGSNAINSGNLIAQASPNDPLPDSSGKQISDRFSNFLKAPFSPTNSTVVLPVLVENFVYVNGGVGRPEGDINTGVFNFFFKENFGVLCGSSVAIVPPPVTCSGTSAFSPNLSQEDIKRLSSVVLSFDYAYTAPLTRVSTSQLRLVVTNVTTRTDTFKEVLPISPGQSIKFKITEAIVKGGPGVYAVKLVLISPQTFPSRGSSVSGFNNVAVNVTRAF